MESAGFLAQKDPSLTSGFRRVQHNRGPGADRDRGEVRLDSREGPLEALPSTVRLEVLSEAGGLR